MSRGITISYFLILGAMIGIEFSVGALVAPIIFFPTQFLGEGVLTHYQSGILMTQIFLRFNMILFFSVIVLWLFEFYMYIKIQKDKLSLVLLVVVTLLVSLFIFYYTPFIVEAQALGAKATQTPEFDKMHSMSEIVMKALMVAQIGLFFRRLMVVVKAK